MAKGFRILGLLVLSALTGADFGPTGGEFLQQSFIWPHDYAEEFPNSAHDSLHRMKKEERKRLPQLDDTRIRAFPRCTSCTKKERSGADGEYDNQPQGAYQSGRLCNIKSSHMDYIPSKIDVNMNGAERRYNIPCRTKTRRPLDTKYPQYWEEPVYGGRYQNWLSPIPPPTATYGGGGGYSGSSGYGQMYPTDYGDESKAFYPGSDVEYPETYGESDAGMVGEASKSQEPSYAENYGGELKGSSGPTGASNYGMGGDKDGKENTAYVDTEDSKSPAGSKAGNAGYSMYSQGYGSAADYSSADDEYDITKPVHSKNYYDNNVQEDSGASKSYTAAEAEDQGYSMYSQGYGTEIEPTSSVDSYGKDKGSNGFQSYSTDDYPSKEAGEKYPKKDDYFNLFTKYYTNVYKNGSPKEYDSDSYTIYSKGYDIVKDSPKEGAEPDEKGSEDPLYSPGNEKGDGSKPEGGSYGDSDSTKEYESQKEESEKGQEKEEKKKVDSKVDQGSENKKEESSTASKTNGYDFGYGNSIYSKSYEEDKESSAKGSQSSDKGSGGSSYVSTNTKEDLDEKEADGYGDSNGYAGQDEPDDDSVKTEDTKGSNDGKSYGYSDNSGSYDGKDYSNGGGDKGVEGPIYSEEKDETYSNGYQPEESKNDGDSKYSNFGGGYEVLGEYPSYDGGDYSNGNGDKGVEQPTYSEGKDEAYSNGYQPEESKSDGDSKYSNNGGGDEFHGEYPSYDGGDYSNGNGDKGVEQEGKHETYSNGYQPEESKSEGDSKYSNNGGGDEVLGQYPSYDGGEGYEYSNSQDFAEEGESKGRGDIGNSEGYSAGNGAAGKGYSEQGWGEEFQQFDYSQDANADGGPSQDSEDYGIASKDEYTEYQENGEGEKESPEEQTAEIPKPEEETEGDQSDHSKDSTYGSMAEEDDSKNNIYEGSDQKPSSQDIPSTADSGAYVDNDSGNGSETDHKTQSSDDDYEATKTEAETPTSGDSDPEKTDASDDEVKDSKEKSPTYEDNGNEGLPKALEGMEVEDLAKACKYLQEYRGSVSETNDASDPTPDKGSKEDEKETKTETSKEKESPKEPIPVEKEEQKSAEDVGDSEKKENEPLQHQFTSNARANEPDEDSSSSEEEKENAKAKSAKKPLDLYKILQSHFSRQKYLSQLPKFFHRGQAAYPGIHSYAKHYPPHVQPHSNPVQPHQQADYSHKKQIPAVNHHINNNAPVHKHNQLVYKPFTHPTTSDGNHHQYPLGYYANLYPSYHIPASNIHTKPPKTHFNMNGSPLTHYSPPKKPVQYYSKPSQGIPIAEKASYGKYSPPSYLDFPDQYGQQKPYFIPNYNGQPNNFNHKTLSNQPPQTIPFHHPNSGMKEYNQFQYRPYFASHTKHGHSELPSALYNKPAAKLIQNSHHAKSEISSMLTQPNRNSPFIHKFKPSGYVHVKKSEYVVPMDYQNGESLHEIGHHLPPSLYDSPNNNVHNTDTNYFIPKRPTFQSNHRFSDIEQPFVDDGPAKSTWIHKSAPPRISYYNRPSFSSQHAGGKLSVGAEKCQNYPFCPPSVSFPGFSAEIEDDL